MTTVLWSRRHLLSLCAWLSPSVLWGARNDVIARWFGELADAHEQRASAELNLGHVIGEVQE